MEHVLKDMLMLSGWIAILGSCYFLLSRNFGRRKSKSGGENDDAP